MTVLNVFQTQVTAWNKNSYKAKPKSVPSLNTFGHPVPFYFLVHHLECEQKLSIVTGLKDKPTHLVRVELESVSVWFFLDF